ncbi:MAG: hypothetical protein WKG07_06420 [Hymenobacter sp.]
MTAQREVETQRDAQRAFYETILDEVPTEIVVLDEQQRYVYANIQAVPRPRAPRLADGPHSTRLLRPLRLSAEPGRAARPHVSGGGKKRGNHILGRLHAPARGQRVPPAAI